MTWTRIYINGSISNAVRARNKWRIVGDGVNCFGNQQGILRDGTKFYKISAGIKMNVFEFIERHRME